MIRPGFNLPFNLKDVYYKWLDQGSISHSTLKLWYTEDLDQGSIYHSTLKMSYTEDLIQVSFPIQP